MDSLYMGYPQYREIMVFYDGSYGTLKWLRALIWANDIFKKYKVRIHFYGPVGWVPAAGRVFQFLWMWDVFRNVMKKKYDIVFLAFHHPRGISGVSAPDRAEILQMLRERCNKLIWLDTADSPGTCLFDVLPYVDKYLKKQMYSDISLYRRNLYADRLFTEYWHSELGLNDEYAEKIVFTSLNEEYRDKLGLSWNIGLGEYLNNDCLKKIFYRKEYAPIFWGNPTENKEIDVHCRYTVQPGIYGYQRRKSLEIISCLNDVTVSDPNLNIKGKKYQEEMKKARMVFSPFGWGEICIRDFEAFRYGAALIKPDMSHLVTYPDWYCNNERYIAVDWKLDNLCDIIKYYSKGEGVSEACSIAQNGQAYYRGFLSSLSGKEDFVIHILREIGIENS